MKKLYWGLLAAPASALAAFSQNDTVTFVAAVVAIVPLAALIGKATEDLAAHTGPRLGGLLNATFGNVTELIIATFLILAGEGEVVKVTITGSIVGNLLLVLGASFFFGGLKFREQFFNAQAAGVHTTSMVLAVVGMMMPALFHGASPRAGFLAEETVSLGVALVLMVLYISSLIFSFVTHQQLLAMPHDEQAKGWSKKKAGLILLAATAGVAFESELLVHSLEAASRSIGLSKLFVGLIVVPIVGNAAEHSSAVLLAMKNKVDTAIEIAVGSSTQIALFVAPALVIISVAVGKPMNFFFSGFEVAVVGMSAAIVALIALDGRANWLEGAQLMAAYVIMGLSFYFL